VLVAIRDVANERSRPELAQLLSKAPLRGLDPSSGNYGTIEIEDQPKERF